MSEEDSLDINNMSHTYEGDSFFELEKNTGSLEQIWIDKNCSDKTNYLTSDDYTDDAGSCPELECSAPDCEQCVKEKCFWSRHISR